MVASTAPPSAVCCPALGSLLTKLRALELTEFTKIVVMDTDLLVLRDVDELFAFPAPAACFRGNTEQRPGAQRDSRSFYDSNGNRHGGINAGVMVLEPSKLHFDRMCRNLWDQDYSAFASRGPEPSWWGWKLYLTGSARQPSQPP